MKKKTNDVVTKQILQQELKTIYNNGNKEGIARRVEKLRPNWRLRKK